MKKKLFIEIFENIQEKTGNTSKNSIVKNLSDRLIKYGITGVSDRNLTRYFDKYIDNKEDAINPKVELLDAISKELSYNDYEDYVYKNKQDTNEDKSNKNLGMRTVNQYGEKSNYIENNSGPINNI